MTTFSSIIRQQWRYNYGDTQFLMFFVGNRNIKEEAQRAGARRNT